MKRKHLTGRALLTALSVFLIHFASAQQTCQGSLLFDNTTTAVGLPLTNQYYTDANGGYTWECWFKLYSPPGSNNATRPLISAIDWTTFEDNYLGFGWDGGWYDVSYDSLVFKVDGPGSTPPSGPNCAWAPFGGFALNTWYHAAGVMNYVADTAYLYVNGVLVDAKPVTVPGNPRVYQTNLSAWGVPNPANTLDGLMDEVRIWDRALTGAEVAAQYKSCLVGNEPNLVLYYRANQVGAMTVLDATNNFYDGNFPSNVPSWSTDNAPVSGAACKAACSCLGALDFDANNIAVGLPLSNQYYTDANGGYTWETWFKLHSVPGSVNAVRPLISAIDWTTFEDNYFGFGWDGGWYDVSYDSLVFKVDGPGSAPPTGPNCAWAPAGGFLAGRWYHAAGVMDYNADTAYMYVDGVLVDKKPVTVAGNPRTYQTNLSAWGTPPDRTNTLDGLMDEVRIWNRVLSAAEIASNYTKCRTGTEANLMVYYRCNQVGATSVIDGSGNARTGTFYNVPGWSTENAPVTGTCKKECNRDPDDPDNPDGKETGITRQSSEHAGLKIYPNPSSEAITISSTQPGVLTVYGLTGQVLSKIQVQESQREVKLEGYKRGIYLYEFTSGSSTSFGKLLVE